jgi:ADP-ribose pyrophosphatase
MAYQLAEKQVIFEGRRIRVELHHLRGDDGKLTRKEVVIHPGAVVILPLLDEENVVLIQNRRHAIGQNLLELPAGTLEHNEIPMNAAGRELLEETGYLARRMKPLFSFYSSPGILTEKMHVFAAYDLERSKSALEDGEEIEAVTVRLTDAIDMIRTGEIIDAKTIATLLMYDRFHRPQMIADRAKSADATIKME